MEGCSNLNPKNYNLLILQLNIRSLLAHQQEHRQLLHELEKRNSRIDVLLLCETFLSKNTINMVNIPDYTHFGNYWKEHKGQSISILLKNGIPYKRRDDLNIFLEGQTESIFTEITSKCGKPIVIRSMYRPPNTDLTQFKENPACIVSKVDQVKGKTPPDIIIEMDHNTDLLKGNQHTPTQKFINETAKLNLLPTIT